MQKTETYLMAGCRGIHIQFPVWQVSKHIYTAEWWRNGLHWQQTARTDQQFHQQKCNLPATSPMWEWKQLWGKA